MGDTAPATPGNLERQMYGVLQELGQQWGLTVEGSVLLRLHSNAIFALPSCGLVVRIATNPKAWTRVSASIAATRWLAGRGIACTVPADSHAQPLQVRGYTVSLWRYESTVPDPPPGPGELGRLLQSLHSQPTPPHPLPELRDPFASVSDALGFHPEVMANADREWLTSRITELRQQWEALRFPHHFGLIHGDAHPNNLMRRACGPVVLGDWDQVCHGPREWDLAQVHYTHRRFGRPTPPELDRFAEAYGWDVRDWGGLETLIQVREVRGLSAYIRTAAAKPFSRDELAYRLRTLRDGNAMARWASPTAQ